MLVSAPSAQQPQNGSKSLKRQYQNRLQKRESPWPILADYPELVEPLKTDERYEAPPLVNELNGDLFVRAWRYWYNTRGIVEMENRLEAKAVAIIVVHPWGIDEGTGYTRQSQLACLLLHA